MLNKKYNNLVQKSLVSAVAFSMCSMACALTPLDDEALSEKTGQNNTLLTISTVGVGEEGNPNSDIGFTKLGLQGKLELNANIRKLQLGCGGVNGSNGCDIDVDYARFVGISSLDSEGNPIPDGGPKSAFELINPFFELAIKNPESLTDRKFVGMRVGGEQSRGILSAGTRPVNEDGSARVFKNGDIDDPNYHTGINSFSANVQRIVVNNIDVPTTFLGLVAKINANESNGENIFTDLYASRASELRLATLKAKAIGLTLNGDLITDNRLLHNIKIGGGTEENPIYSDSFFVSLSSLGDNKVWITNTGDKSISRETGGDRQSVVNQLAPNPLEDRLQWQTNVNGSTEWKEALRGWSFFLPEIRIENARTSTVNIPFNQVIGGVFGKTVPINQLDLKQVPVDNCYGGLTFC